MNGWTRKQTDRGFLDRSKPFSFSVNGKPGLGFLGDSLASAMLANGVSSTGFGVRTGRPRGIMASGDAEQNAYMRLRENGDSRVVLASMLELYEGLEAESLMPSQAARNAHRSGDNFFESADDGPPSHQVFATGFASTRRYGHCDVLVVGSGPAGYGAARAAALAGARVIVVDSDHELGGSLLWCPATIDGEDGLDWVRGAWSELGAQKHVHLLRRASAVGFDEKGRVTVMQLRADEGDNGGPATGKRIRIWRIQARQVILATGAAERSLVFPDNDKPGVFLADGLLEYANRYGLSHKGDMVMMTNSDAGHRSACALHDAGYNVKAVVDYRTDMDAAMISPLCDRGIDILGNRAVVRIDGENEVREVSLAPISDGHVGNATESYNCDLVAVAGGAAPRLDLFTRAGGTLHFDAKRNMLMPDKAGQIDMVAGAAAGNTGVSAALNAGTAAGQEAAVRCDYKVGTLEIPNAEEFKWNQHPPAALWSVTTRDIDGGKGNQWVDLRSDKTVGDYEDEDEDGLLSPLSDAQLQGPAVSIGPERVLVEIEPELPQPRRLLPTHSWHVEKQAAFRRLQDWLRPAFYPQEGKNAEEVLADEVKAVRNAAGIHDLSATGKIEVTGPDAREFLNRIYCSDLASLAPGQVRYSMMLDESGSILDHGVIACLADDRFFLTTSVGDEKTALAWLRGWLTSDWQDMLVFVSPVTHQWASIVISGPRARQALLNSKIEIDVSTAALPLMAIREGTAYGVPARIMRIGHLGEVSFEIYVPADYGLSLWRKLLVAGRDLGLTPFGEDAFVRLMAEKGRIRLGAAGDAALTPFDLGFSNEITSVDTDFIGKSALERPGARDRHRLQLVGLVSEEPGVVLPQDGIVLSQANPRHNDELQDGLVAASFNSFTLKQPITLGLVSNGQSRVGEAIKIRTGAREYVAKIVKPTIYDPHGRRRHG